MNKTLYILDGYGLIFRSYFAHMRNPLINSKGQNTSAIYGFFQAIKKIYANYSPNLLLVALDPKGKTFRSEMYKEYKATRDNTPEDLSAQFPIILELLDTLAIPSLSISGMEADDIIASYAHKARQEGLHTRIISSDKDLFQLIDAHTYMLRPSTKSSDWEEVDSTWVEAHIGVKPSQIRDYLAIIGDSSDNVPGIKGLGPKSAVSLLEEYGSLEGIYNNIDSIKEVWRKKLFEHRELAKLSYDLVSLKCDLQVPDIASLKCDTLNWGAAQSIFHAQEIFSFNTTSSKRTHAAPDTNSDIPTSSTQDTDTTTTQNTQQIHKTARDVPHSYKIIQTHKELDELVRSIIHKKLVCIDTETDTVDTILGVPVGISLSTTAHEGYYIPIRYPPHSHYPIELEESKIRSAMQSILDGRILLIMFNMKFDLAIFHNWGIDLEPLYAACLKGDRVIFDVMISSWMIPTPNIAFSMDAVSTQYLSYIPISYKSLIDTEHNSPAIFSKVDLAQAVEYAVEDVDVTLQLYHYFLRELESHELLEPFYDIEMPLLCVIMDIERRGLMVNTQALNTLSKMLEDKISSMSKEIYSLCGKEFNINSTKQLQEILFGDLGLQHVKKNKTGYSTDISTLEFLANQHSVPKKILEYRHLSKLKSTYTDSLPEQVHPHTKRIHTSLQQIGTATGRISSINPNLQNIPVKDEWGTRIRSCFIAPKAYTLIGADYSQIELVVLAHLSQDENMVDAFHNNVDIHKRTAAILFNTTESKVDSQLRRVAKTINFGIIYGMSAFRLSNELQIPQKDARDFISRYFEEFSGITQFIAETIKITRERKFTTTLFGHKRAIPNIDSNNKTLKNAAERIAVNTVIQGSAAEIVKKAMLAIHRRIRSETLQSKMVLQIHDELLFECPNSEKDLMLELVRNEMEHVVNLSIPLKISIDAKQDWGALK